ncbi:MAG: hypothetical protein HOW73_14660 [Polyangiaceae bacterium]|nr:hypothetical protein [Polyangiaceae bacterium]
MKPSTSTMTGLGSPFLLCVALLAACGDDTNQNPTSTFTTSTGGGTSDGGGGQGAGGNGGAPEGGNGAGGNCEGPDGCFACEPTKNEHFLNACTEAQCSPFDNEARLPLYNGGDLPPVP